MPDAYVMLPLSVERDGRTWHMYAMDYKADDRTFSTYIYAISDTHAEAICDDIRDGATIAGRVEYVEDAE